MLDRITKCATGSCEVLEFPNNLFIYPIFKNGSGSLTRWAQRKNYPVIIDNNLQALDNITVYLRNSTDRFVSGVSTYFWQRKKPIKKENLQLIEQGKITDMHFVPQYIWLMKLYRFFKGTVSIEHVEKINDLVPYRFGPSTGLSGLRKKKILSIGHRKYTWPDEILMQKYLGKNVLLKNIITDKDIRNALS